ncbi:MAG: hypothetical protein JXL80_16700 [Planctomycetes bacterium]|nr:hypothetical protein [Planctomycetota bacterium]
MKPRWILTVALLAVTCAATGCAELLMDRAKLFGDTYTRDRSGFSDHGPQWAYEGEAVTFDFAPDPDITDYAVFSWPGGTNEYIDKRDTFETDRFYRTVHRFEAGREPRQYVVSAEAYAIYQQNDWYYDRDTGEWVYHLTHNDVRDTRVGSASLKVVCYRVEIAMTFKPGARQVKNAVLLLLKDDGSRVERRMKVDQEQPGFELVGPDAKGVYTVRYVPTWNEVNRTGTTEIELRLTYADGSQDVISQTIDTP